MKALLFVESRAVRYLLTAMFHPLCLALLVASVAPEAAHAQDASGALEGRVTDTRGAAVAMATVELRNMESNASRSQTSDVDGRYRFVQLSVGHYALSIDATGFARVSEPGPPHLIK